MTNLEMLRAATPEQIKEWLDEEVNAPKDVPTRWVKLKTVKGNIYINASTIVGLGEPNAAEAPAEVLTTVFTIGAEDNPWLVCDCIDAVMEKIKKA
jgi:hypothetical protein